MRIEFLVVFLAVVSLTQSAPVVPGLVDRNEDIFGGIGQISPASLIDVFLRLLLAEEAPRQRASINPLDLISIAGRFLGGAGERASIDETEQDPRVLNFDQEINRRNQLSRFARVFSSILLR